MNFNTYVKENYRMKIDNDTIEFIIAKIDQCIENKVNIYVAGNGGSAYNGNHFVQDLIKVCGARAISLSENIGLILAVGNDISFDNIFKFQLENRDIEGVFIAISCSGNSKNILEAAKYANDLGLTIISFTGNNGGQLKKLSDWNVNIPTSNIFVSESIHSMIFHYIVDRLNDYN